MPEFSASRWREAQEPWTYRDLWLGRECAWIARPVSANAVIAAAAEMEGASLPRRQVVMRQLFRRAFPWNPAMAWRGNPVKLIDALPLAAWDAVITSFFDWATGRNQQGVAPYPPVPSAPDPLTPVASPPSPTPSP